MRKNILYLLLILLIFSFSCKNKSSENLSEETTDSAKEFSVPDTYKLISSTKGDLDKDNIDEIIYLYLTNEDKDTNGFDRKIYICKKENNKTIIWKEITGPVLSADYLHQNIDPFEEILIDENKIYIIHSVEAENKFYFNHCFEFKDNDFYLTKATVDYAIPCEKWDTYIIDFNTKIVSHQSSPDWCDDEPIGKKFQMSKQEYKVEDLQSYKMQGFIPGNNKLIIPNTKIEVYF